MTSRKLLLRWASGIMVVMSGGHLSLLMFLKWEVMAGWAERGLWATVPLLTEGDLANKATFWGSLGSFSIPLILLGCLIWHLAGRGVAVPAEVGWGVAAWCLVSGVLLVPSPFVAGIISGLLIVRAARIPREKETLPL
jgi:hypothetical protein